MRFEDAMRAVGLRPRDIVADGKWRRCATEDKPRKKNGAYALYPDGRGFWKNWATDSEPHAWREETVTRATPTDPAALERRRAQDRERRMRGIADARALWAAGRPHKGHLYIETKGLTAQGCAGLRIWSGEVGALR